MVTWIELISAGVEIAMVTTVCISPSVVHNDRIFHWTEKDNTQIAKQIDNLLINNRLA